MKKIFLGLMSIMAVHSALCQNIKNEKIDVKYLRAPYTPLKKEIKTYRTKVEVLGISLVDVVHDPKKRVESTLNLIGYQKNQVDADMEVYARLEGFVTDETRVFSEERSETKSDKTVVKYKVYFGSTYMKYPMYLRLNDIKADQIIFQGYIGNSDQFINQKTPEYRTYGEAESAINTIVSDGKGKMLDQNLSRLRDKLNNDYSAIPNEERWSINYVETSKKVNYDDVMSARDSTKLALESLSNTSYSISEVSKTKTLNAISMWMKILAESDPEDRKARIDKKVTQAILENLAFCNFFIRQFTESEKWIAESKKLSKQPWQFSLEQMMIESKTRLKANDIAFF